MTPQELLQQARAGDLDRLAGQREAVATAVHAFADAGDAAAALELVGRTWRIWGRSGEIEEGGALAAAALGTPGASTAPLWLARVLYADGLFAFRAGDRERSLARNEEALRVARGAGDVRGECDALTGLARLALRDGRYEEVVALAGQARERAQAAGDREAEAGPLHLQAAGVRLLRDYRRARELYVESLGLNIELGNASWAAMEQDCLGWVELHLGNVDEAERRFRDREASATGDDPYGVAWTELEWSAVAAARGDVDEARRRFAAGARALDALGSVLDPDDQAEFNWLREELGIEP